MAFANFYTDKQGKRRLNSYQPKRVYRSRRIKPRLPDPHHLGSGRYFEAFYQHPYWVHGLLRQRSRVVIERPRGGWESP